jgi:hypothetical protein
VLGLADKNCLGLRGKRERAGLAVLGRVRVEPNLMRLSIDVAPFEREYFATVRHPVV